MAQVTQAARRDPIRSLSNRIFLKISGKWFRAYSIVTHTGRRSGRQYRNPVSAYPLGDGFVIAVLYGAQSQRHRDRSAHAPHQRARPSAGTAADHPCAASPARISRTATHNAAVTQHPRLRVGTPRGTTLNNASRRRTQPG
jgi:hypothetical protein